MTELLRTFSTPDLEIRSAAKGGDGRTIYGIAVPWNAPQRIDENLTEQFADGTFNHQLRAANRINFSREHIKLGGALIGPTMLLRNDAAGLYFEARASRTPLGDETLELVKDRALRHISIAFRERQNRRVPGGNIVERVTADLREIAVTLEGAYGDLAVATGVRTAGAGGDHDGVTWAEECDRACCRTERLEQARLLLAELPALPAP